MQSIAFCSHQHTLSTKSSTSVTANTFTFISYTRSLFSIKMKQIKSCSERSAVGIPCLNSCLTLIYWEKDSEKLPEMLTLIFHLKSNSK